jgi:hypothetical protein
MNYYLSIDECPRHGFMAVSIGNKDTGTRLTPSKCCGSWETVHSWKVTSQDIDSMVEELLAAKEQIEA